MASANAASLSLTSEKLPVRTVAVGCSSCAIAAVDGSSSTPVTGTPAGASARNMPEPQPGSSTGPPR